MRNHPCITTIERAALFKACLSTCGSVVDLVMVLIMLSFACKAHTPAIHRITALKTLAPLLAGSNVSVTQYFN